MTDINSAASAERFRELASTFTKEATSSKRAAQELLQREGIIDKNGGLSKRYSEK